MGEENNQSATGTGTGAAKPEPGTSAPMFDQAAVDAIVTRRLTEEAKRHPQVDPQLLEKARKFDEMQAAQLSEQERLNAALAEARQKADAAEAGRKTALIERVALGLMQGQVAPDRQEDALRLLDLSAVSFDETGKPVGVDKALEALLARSAYLKGEAVAAPGGQTDQARRGIVSPTNPGAKPPKDDYSWLTVNRGKGKKTSFG